MQYWNGCSGEDRTTSLTLSTGSFTSAVETVATGCTAVDVAGSSLVSSSSSSSFPAAALETGMAVVAGQGHVPDARMAARAWAFLSRYARRGAAAELPRAAANVSAGILYPDPDDTTVPDFHPTHPYY